MLFVLFCFTYSIMTEHYTIFALPYSLVIAPLVSLGCFVYYQSKFKPAKYFVISWGISLSLIGIDDLAKYDIVYFYPDFPFTLLGHMIESIILSYAISEKTNLMVKEQELQRGILIHQAKLASMGQMLENISHQWRQPLNLEKSVERGFIVQDTGFTVLSKNFSFTHRLSGCFLEVLWNQ